MIDAPKRVSDAVRKVPNIVVAAVIAFTAGSMSVIWLVTNFMYDLIDGWTALVPVLIFAAVAGALIAVYRKGVVGPASAYRRKDGAQLALTGSLLGFVVPLIAINVSSGFSPSMFYLGAVVPLIVSVLAAALVKD